MLTDEACALRFLQNFVVVIPNFRASAPIICQHRRLWFLFGTQSRSRASPERPTAPRDRPKELLDTLSPLPGELGGAPGGLQKTMFFLLCGGPPFSSTKRSSGTSKSRPKPSREGPWTSPGATKLGRPGAPGVRLQSHPATFGPFWLPFWSPQGGPGTLWGGLWDPPGRLLDV